MLERRLHSMVTASLARRDDNEEIKRKINILTVRQEHLCILTLRFFLFDDLHAIPTPLLDNVNPLNLRRHRHSIP